jgi:hypothetical protein
VVSLRKNRGDPAPARSWPDYGRVDQEAVGEPTTSFETPGRMVAHAEASGERLGSARASESEAVGKDSGVMQEIAGASRARKAVIDGDSQQEKLAASRVAATKDPRKRANAAQVAASKRRLERLQKHDLPVAEEAVRGQKAAVARLAERYEQLPRYLKGYIGSLWVMLAIEVGVIAFEGGALHTALAHAGFSAATVIYLSVAVPMLLAAINHGLGIVAGAIGRELGPRRLKVAVGVFAAGFGALVSALVLLTILRIEATAAQNTANARWASGQHSGSPVALLSPVWLGPAQIAGSIAAIAVVALFTVAKDGRELIHRLGVAEGVLAERERTVRSVEADIESAHQEQEALVIAATDIDVAVAEAQASLKAHDEIRATRLNAEEGLAEAARGRARSRFLYTLRIYENGRVMKVALATVVRKWRRYTPPPGDMAGEPYRPAEPSQNGHRQTSLDDLQPRIGG